MAEKYTYADDLMASREWQYRTAMAVVVRQIEGGNSELKLYGTLFARAMIRAYSDVLYGFEAELQRVGANTSSKKKPLPRVRSRDDDDDDAVG